MVRNRTRPKPLRFIWIFIIGILAATLISLSIGYIVGMRSVGFGQLNDRQNDFVKGVAQGSSYRADHQTGKEDKKKDEDNIRAHPDIRCASKYYPQNPISMAGCLQGIADPPEGRYSIPMTDG